MLCRISELGAGNTKDKAPIINPPDAPTVELKTETENATDARILNWICGSDSNLPPPYKIVTCGPHEIHALRKAILRPTEPDISWCKYPGDWSEAARHWRIIENGHAVGMISIIPSNCTTPIGKFAFRLRGLGVLTERRNQGLGTKLLTKALDYLRETEEGGWLSARTHHLDWYGHFGFEPFGLEYCIPGTGPHRDMALPVRSLKNDIAELH